jgi:uncharacterized membrane protein YeaQ/YmgE (transglycosylase-associated protein family)
MLNWFHEEFKFWSRDDIRGGLNDSRFNEHFHQLDSCRNTLINMSSEATAAECLFQVTQFFDLYKSGYFLHRTDPIAQAVGNLQLNGGDRFNIYRIQTCLFKGHGLDAGQAVVAASVISYLKSLNGVEFGIEALDRAIHDRLAIWSKEYVDEAAKWSEHLESHREISERGKGAVIDANAALDTAKTGVTNLLKELTDDVAATKKRLNEEMVLKAPVEYWTARAKSQMDTGTKLFGASIAAGLVGGILLTWSTSSIFSKPTPPTLLEFIPHILPAVLLLWLLRLLVRFALQRFALAADAQERVVLTKTFLAYEKVEGLEFKSEERLIMLNALFRGATKADFDDAAPASIMDRIIDKMKP